jgi:hypothetical protein
MSWLLVAKILPPFFNGEPPSTGVLLSYQAVAWSIEVDGAPVGSAVSLTVPGALDATEVHSRVSLKNIPLKEIAPHWMANLVQNIGDIQLDMRTRTTIDPLGHLASFDTKVNVNELPSAIRMLGAVKGESLQIKLQAGDFKRRFEYPWPKDTWLGRELTPDAKLLRVYVGRKWQRDVYSPLSAPQNPMEVVEAEVVEDHPILHNGHLVNARRVEYRTLSGAGIAADNRLRSNVWVADDGTVLRQDAYFMNVRLRFERLDDKRANELAASQLDLAHEATVVPSAD